MGKERSIGGLLGVRRSWVRVRRILQEHDTCLIVGPAFSFVFCGAFGRGDVIMTEFWRGVTKKSTTSSSPQIREDCGGEDGSVQDFGVGATRAGTTPIFFLSGAQGC
ncbi:uncharacterized protein H6S33_004869 [Morchella sextelata]|uniref:uncharacterized protein n=1 Tax=Morchella sextelata TaxID=1174677 RepID=UPI001D052E73|nr:uncharacterized protein H6S33_004869 [Morchella sextelata]KAH0605647.1 hypothetical protein H6S33_004869 [Morchella sextelata]